MLAEFRRRYPTVTCVGVESSPDAAAFCLRRHGLQVASRPWQSIDAEELPGSFDLITLIHVLEHVPDPVGMLMRAVNRLSPNGLIYIEVPDLQSERWSGKDFFHIAHVWYFHEVALRNLFLRCGLKIIDVTRGAADIWSWAIGFVGQKNLINPLPTEAIPAVTEDLKEHLRDHVNRTVSRQQTRRFSKLLDHHKVSEFLRNLFVTSSE